MRGHVERIPQVNKVFGDTGGRADSDAEGPAPPRRAPYTVLAEVLDHEGSERSITATIAAESDAQTNPVAITARRRPGPPGRLSPSASHIVRAERSGVDAGRFLAGHAGRPGAD